MAEERKNSEIRVHSEATLGEAITADFGLVSAKKKKKSRESTGEDGEIVARVRDKLGEDVIVSKKSNKERADSEVEDDGKKPKKKKKDKRVDSEAEEGLKISKKKNKEKKVDSESVKKSMKKHKKIKVDSEADDDDEKKKESGGYEVGNSESSQVYQCSESGKRKEDDSVLRVEENTDNSNKEIERKRKKKKKSEDPVAEETDAKKKRKKKHGEDSEVEENNKDSRKDAKKQKLSKSDKDMTSPSSKSTKKVKFSEQVEVFPTEDEELRQEDGEKEVELVRGKRFSKEEDALIEKSVLQYIDNHALGEEGLKMVLACGSHPQLRGCWKEIASALPWRPCDSVYYRAHTVFEAGSTKGIWTKEDLELVK